MVPDAGETPTLLSLLPADSSESGAAQSQVLVLQYGAHWCRAGLASASNLPCAFRTILNKVSSTIQFPSQRTCQATIACIDEAHILEVPFYLRLREHAVHCGSVIQWDNFSGILNHIIREDLRLSPEDHPVLVVLPPLSTPADRHRLCAEIFEQLDVPVAAFTSAASLTLQAFGLSTGIVLDCGSSCTTATAVHMSQPVPHAACSLLLGEDDMMHHVLCAVDARQGNVGASTYSALAGKGLVTHSTCIALVRSFTNTFCFVAPSSEPPAAVDAASITLPFTTYFSVEEADVSDACWQCPELLFRPSYDSSSPQADAGPLSIRELLQQLPETQLKHFCLTIGIDSVDATSFHIREPPKHFLMRKIDEWLAAALPPPPARRDQDLQALFDAFMRQRQGVADMVHTCVQACDSHLRPQMYENVVMCGGLSMFPGFKHRLLRKLYTNRNPLQPQTLNHAKLNPYQGCCAKFNVSHQQLVCESWSARSLRTRGTPTAPTSNNGTDIRRHF